MATFDEQSFPSQMRTAIFRDQHHVRRLNVRPYHRLVVLVRGHRPSVLPPTPFKAGPTDHGSTIVEISPGILEDQLPAPVITKDNVDDKALWGNNL